MFTSIIKGIWTALRHPKLVLLLWAWNLALGLAAAMPARAWFSRMLDHATETDLLLERFSFGAFGDMSKYNEAAPFSLIVSALVGIGFVALLGSAFLNGGMVEVISTKAESRTFMHRFFRGGGHFFWRFFRLGLVAVASGVVVVGIVAGVVGSVTGPLGDSEWEPAGMFWGLVTMAVAGLVALWFVLALDYARIRVARDGSRGMVRVYVASLGFVLRHGLATYGIAITYLVLVCIALLAYVAHETVWTTSTWAAILVLLGVQQVLMLARTGFRVMQVGAEWEYFAMCTPAVPAPVVVMPVPPEQTVPSIAEGAPQATTEQTSGPV